MVDGFVKRSPKRLAGAADSAVDMTARTTANQKLQAAYKLRPERRITDSLSACFTGLSMAGGQGLEP